jgi:hypothetical protein
LNKIQTIIRENLENWYSSKLETLDEMNKFLSAFNQPKLNQEDISHLNKSCSSHSLLTKKSPCQALVTHGCNPSYSGGRDQEVHSLKPVQANSSWDSILKIPNTTRAVIMF